MLGPWPATVQDFCESDVSSNLFLFVDILLICIIHTPDDEIQLQDLDSLDNWTIFNSMSSNSSKTKVMHETRRQHFYNAVYTLRVIQPLSVSSRKYLGVVISAITACVNRLLGFIRVVACGSFTFAIFALYQALALPILEHGVPALHLNTSSQIQQIEQIHCIATDIALKKEKRGDRPNEERLRILHWPTLSACREHFLCSNAFKCLYSCCACDRLMENT